MGRKREFKSSRDFCSLPDKIEYTHVCRLCWPQGTFDSDDNPSEASPAGSGDQELEDDNASSWLPLEPPQQGWEGCGDSLDWPNPAEWEG